MKLPDITPGPWEQTDAYEATFYNDLRTETVIEINGRDAGNSPAYATSPADAQAIAATPDTLAALAAVLQSVTGERESIGVAVVSLDSLKQARAALEKAGAEF